MRAARDRMLSEEQTSARCATIFQTMQHGRATLDSPATTMLTAPTVIHVRQEYAEAHLIHATILCHAQQMHVMERDLLTAPTQSVPAV
jgi:hypothetical protein